MNSPFSKILFNSEQINVIVKRLAQEINSEYHNLEEDLIVVGILKGSFFFMSDLIRALAIPVQMDFMEVSSYHDKTTSSGKLQIKKKLSLNVQNKHVLIVEDIIDTGQTFSYLRDYFLKQNVASLKSVVLLDKPSRRVIHSPIEFIGVEIPDEFVCGYGLDYAQKYREFPMIGILAPHLI